MAEEKPSYPKWSELLLQAVMQPGRLHQGYSAFHRYSVGNQCLAMAQCIERGLPIGPIATYNKWVERGRRVRKGEKAVVLCRPIIMKAKEADQNDGGHEGYVRFSYRPYWFTLWQTEPDAEYDGPAWAGDEPPDWDPDRALAHLDVTEVRFEDMNGNVQGYSEPGPRTLAINPVAVYPTKTRFHELAHILLGHKHSGEHCEQEVEAELTAYLLVDTLQVDVGGLESSRAYVQNYLGAYVLNDTVAQRVFKCADRILQAGYPGGKRMQEAA